MRKIIDVRFRPPLGSFLTWAMYRNKEKYSQMIRAAGMEISPSILKDSMELLLGEMNSVGDYRCCVTGSKRGIDRAWGWIENEELAEMVRQYPDRFIGIGAIDGTDGIKAVEDVEKCVKEFGFKAIVMETGAQTEPMYCDDRRLYPIYEKCLELGIPVFLLAGGNAGPNITYSEPVHVERVAIDMPQLKIVVLHGGWPWVTQILHLAYRRPNLYLSADCYIKFPGGCHYIEAVNSYLSDRFLYGTSHPLAPVVGYFEQFMGLGIKDEYLDKVLYQNAEKLLRLA